MTALTGCDTFVVLPPLTTHGGVIFGKNSDRPGSEVQEIVYFPQKTYNDGDKVECTYIEIPQVESTKAVLLSKPAWMWGCEMGANDAGVVIGNEAVWTIVESETLEEERLLGMDLVRLGLERSSTASEAIDVIVSLLEEFGQGGPCSDTKDLFYHNSFLIADPKEAWVLETAGRLWAAEKITEGYRNISNSLSITTKIDKMSEKLKPYASENNLWDGESEFNFAKIFQSGARCPREESGRELLAKLTAENKFSVEDMFKILRDNNICFPVSDSLSSATTSSQVSVLAVPESGKPSVHWMTGTPDPSLSVFKPFIFTPNVKISHHTVSPKFDDDPAKVVPRFQKSVDRAHNLYRLHQSAVNGRINVLALLQEMEEGCVQDVEDFIAAFQPGQSLSEFDELLKDVVETEQIVR
ncbi:secernin-2 isoform X2 [Lycorma delicatula]|uniref:secernin-2 isoform X2 n=1 Tax=Lycorma delicatula TaxID=130591 RepID=UPI003F510795